MIGLKKIDNKTSDGKSKKPDLLENAFSNVTLNNINNSSSFITSDDNYEKKNDFFFEDHEIIKAKQNDAIENDLLKIPIDKSYYNLKTVVSVGFPTGFTLMSVVFIILFLKNKKNNLIKKRNLKSCNFDISNNSNYVSQMDHKNNFFPIKNERFTSQNFYDNNLTNNTNTLKTHENPFLKNLQMEKKRISEVINLKGLLNDKEMSNINTKKKFPPYSPLFLRKFMLYLKTKNDNKFII